MFRLLRGIRGLDGLHEQFVQSSSICVSAQFASEMCEVGWDDGPWWCVDVQDLAVFAREGQVLQQLMCSELVILMMTQ
jgi:hypothetical protein